MTITERAERVASAIDLIHSVCFAAGTRPRWPRNYKSSGMTRELLDAWQIAKASAPGAHLRVFQKQGISSKTVAVAVRTGTLIVVDAPAGSVFPGVSA